MAQTTSDMAAAMKDKYLGRARRGLNRKRAAVRKRRRKSLTELGT